MRRFAARVTQVLFFLFICFSRAGAQNPEPRRILQTPDETRLVRVDGSRHPQARAEFDRGAAPSDLPMQRMLLVLRRSGEQQASLQRLLDAQQDRSSPSYHQWLTPEQFGQQFGPADADVQAVAAWLSSHGFQVSSIAKSRMVIEFTGSASQVAKAFHTEIHRYAVNGQDHWANSSDQSIPEALTPVVAGVNSLHDFLKAPMHGVGGIFSREKATGKTRDISSDFSFPNSTACGTDCYFLGPYDFAAIYNLLPLWNATPAINGAGQSIAIVGESNVNIQDIRNFRSMFGLPANDPQIILDGPDPGLVPDDEVESDLDLEWSGAVAPAASIKFVTSASTNTTAGVDLSALYIIENNLAPVMSESYGECEMSLGPAGNQFYSNLWEQAAAQGITVIVSAGDEGSAECDRFNGTAPQPATRGLMVSGLASTPFNVAVGGTDFLNYGTNFDIKTPSPYWNTNNDANHASALGYIPESTWNSSCTNAAYVILDLETSPEGSCNDSKLAGRVKAEGGSGGASNCTKFSVGNTCGGGYAKPGWQVANGVPNDGARDLPDVSLFASPGFLSSAYIICATANAPLPLTNPCDLNAPYQDFVVVGGTSASSPAFAGMIALVNQYTASTGQGNPNYVLYKLASQAAQTSSNCNATSGSGAGCIFNDVTFGTIAMPCFTGTPNCTFTNTADRYGVLSGYGAGAGYDLATGLGSVNAANLVHNWNSVTATATGTATTLLLNNGNTVSVTHGNPVPVSITVTPQPAGSTAPTGDVALFASTQTSMGIDDFKLSSSGALATANGSTSLLPGGSYSVTGHYGGDGTFSPSDSAPVAVTVLPENSTTTVRALAEFGQGLSGLSFLSQGSYGLFTMLRADVTSARSGSNGNDPPAGTVTLTDTFNGVTTQLPFGTVTLDSAGVAVTPNGLFTLAPGMHLLNASYSGDSSYNSSSSSNAWALNVLPALTQTTVSAPNNVVVNSPVSLSVSVNTPAAGLNPLTNTFNNIKLPSGTVTIFSGTTAISSPTPVTGGTNLLTHTAMATASVALNSSQLVPGTATVTAVYSGDPNYAVSTSSATSFTVNSDFSFNTVPSTLPTIFIASPGATSTPITLSVVTAQGSTNTINFTTSSCSITPLGSLSTCNFSPASITGSGSTQLTIVTTAPQTAGAYRPGSRNSPNGRYPVGMGISLFLALCLTISAAFLRGPLISWQRVAMATGLILLASIMGLAGCGGGGSSANVNTPVSTATPGTPEGVTYNVNVTATMGTSSHSASFAFVVR